jgi:peptidoglycan/xylan/chitin deacetylase (PgdA/CDA1 family)
MPRHDREYAMAIPILMYHQIAEPGPRGTPLRGLTVSPRMFAQQMQMLRVLGYRGLSMGALTPYLNGERSGRVVGITFDDGYLNNLQNALPILQRQGFSSTCYVVSGEIGKTNRWDFELGIAQVPLMDQFALQAWIDGGQEVGSHTRSHANLTQVDPRQLEEEICGSRQELESLLTQEGGVQHFCYPYGSLDDAALAMVARASYRTATTTAPGRVVPARQPNLLALPRIKVHRTTTFLHLALKCMTN